MKYTCTIDINLPVDTVMELWANENNFKAWQDGFVKIDRVSGDEGMTGAKSKIYLEEGNRKMELLETVISNNLPEEKSARYEHKHMTNTQTTKFKSIGENQTRYISEVEYVKFNGLMPNLMARLFPGMFKKQSQKWMKQFKEFAESVKGK